MKSLFIVISALLVTACSPYRGFIESEFTLADESPLPVWLEPLPDGYSRDDVKVIIQYYSPPWNVDDTVVMVKTGFRTLEKKTGDGEYHPEYLKWAKEDWANRRYPAYYTVTIDGTTEIIEHKKMEPIFYVSDEGEMRRTMDTATPNGT